MKKFIVFVMAVFLICFMTTGVWADSDSGSGSFYIDADADESVSGGECNSNNGINAGSGYVSNGESDVWATGDTWFFGSASADINAVGGALGNSKDYTFENENGYGSISTSKGITSG
ncbi:MAG: hypothetical protein ACOC2W_01815, partial [bacterium]